MPTDLSQTLVVGISATALFDLSEADSRFRSMMETDRDSAIEEYRSYMRDNENVPLAPGAGYPLVQALLALNGHRGAAEPPLIDVVILTRNSPEIGLRILRSVQAQELNIIRSAFTGGESVVPYLESFGVHLFLTTDLTDAQRVADSNTCAVGLLNKPPKGIGGLSTEQVRMALDGDAVLFDDESEVIYQTKGLEAFLAHERAAQELPLKDGPYAVFLRKLAELQKRLPMRVEYSPVRIALVTARNSPADIRVITTLRDWGVYVDEAFFLGGLDKTPVLRAFKPHIFFDDQEAHLDRAAAEIPSARVPHASHSPLHTNAPTESN